LAAKIEDFTSLSNRNIRSYSYKESFVNPNWKYGIHHIITNCANYPIDTDSNNLNK